MWMIMQKHIYMPNRWQTEGAGNQWKIRFSQGIRQTCEYVMQEKTSITWYQQQHGTSD